AAPHASAPPAASSAPSTPSTPPAPSTERCADAAEHAQLARAAGHLVEARADLLVCASTSCPAVVRRDCPDWYAAVDRALPPIIVVARDAAGADVAVVRVSIDGTRVARADGRAIPLDPGHHHLEVESDAGVVVTREIVAIEGEKERRIDAVFATTTAPS